MSEFGNYNKKKCWLHTTEEILESACISTQSGENLVQIPDLPLSHVTLAEFLSTSVLSWKA